MKEYFVAKAIERALNAADRFAATRELLIRTPIQPEIVGFFKLLGGKISGAELSLRAWRTPRGSVLGKESSVAGRSHYVTRSMTRRADSTGNLSIWTVRFWRARGSVRYRPRGSTLADGSVSGQSTNADLREADLSTDSNLTAGGTVLSIAFCPELNAHRYFCLSPESGLGRIAVKEDNSLSFSFISLPQALRSAEEPIHANQGGPAC